MTDTPTPSPDGKLARRTLLIGAAGASAVVSIRPALAQTQASIITCEIPIPDRARAGQMIAADGQVVAPGTPGAFPGANRPFTGEQVKAAMKGQNLPGAVLVVALTGTAFAHGGEDHDHDAPAATPGSNTPQRLPDGSVFVPKPSQRILEVRTTTAKLTEVEGATRLIGKVIPDPNRGGLVQSIGGGRVIAPEAGMPRLGQAVRKGEVLARVERPIIQADQAIVVEKVGEIEQQIGLAEAKLARARKLVASGAGTAISVSDLEIELEGMRRRRAAVSDIRTTPETLTAPADGVIATTRVAAGQVVQPQDVLFQVVDPGSLWVEALSFEDAPTGTKTSAVTADGTTLTLQAKGVSRALQQQATVLQFAVVDPPAGLKVGQPVTVLAATGASAAGIVLPRNAVVRGTGGEAMVWRHAAPERFEPRQVRVEPVDATRVVVRAGVKEGERVVVRGADLINQIR